MTSINIALDAIGDLKDFGSNKDAYVTPGADDTKLAYNFFFEGNNTILDPYSDSSSLTSNTAFNVTYNNATATTSQDANDTQDSLTTPASDSSYVVTSMTAASITEWLFTNTNFTTDNNKTQARNMLMFLFPRTSNESNDSTDTSITRLKTDFFATLLTDLAPDDTASNKVFVSFADDVKNGSLKTNVEVLNDKLSLANRVYKPDGYSAYVPKMIAGDKIRFLVRINVDNDSSATTGSSALLKLDVTFV